MLNRLTALRLLAECTGDDIWSVEHCELRELPQAWIEELNDCFESGFKADSQTIYKDEQIVNQYHGLRDVDIAIKLGEFLGVDVKELECYAPSRRSLVRAITEAVEEM